LAYKEININEMPQDTDEWGQEVFENDLIFVGLFGIED